MSSTSRQKITQPSHKVNFVGDSHLKGSKIRLTQYLNTQFEVCNPIKPGARTKQLVLSQENELKCLGKNDVLVIAGGANDIDKPNTTINEIIVPMTHFIQKYANTNVVIVNTPHRYGLVKVTVPYNINLNIQPYNVKLKNILKLFTHVSVVEISINGSHFTKYDFHLNKSGKEWIVKQIAKQIDQII
jgi:hypothetical protein